MKHACRWLVYIDGKHVPCGKPVSYTMERDDDHNLRRVYATLCDVHALKAKDIKDDDDEPN